VRLARYRSDGNELKVWHLLPSHNQLWTSEGYPAVIFVHDGTSFSEEELQQARTFSDAGFVVIAPTFRGENGNPGAHELLFGELDDLIAATGYASELPEVDKHKLAIWGHGLGGMLSALASLTPHLGVQFTGSSAGLRPTSAFEVIQSPFEASEQERNMRAFGPNIHHMHSPHWACVAEQDPAVYEEASRLSDVAARSGLPLSVEQVLGNRTTSRVVCTSHAVVLLLQSMRAWGSP
jgi:dienelactone hydrolase